MTTDEREQRSRIRTMHRAATRELLVDAAVDVFREIGYARATVERIVAEAGASRGTFYLHFGTKADILPDLVARGAEVYDRYYVSLADSLVDDDPLAIREWLLRAMDAWDEVRDLMKPVYEAVAAEPELNRRCFNEDVPGLGQMTEAVATIVPVDTRYGELMVEAMFATLQHFFERYLRGEVFDRGLVATLIAEAWSDALARLRESTRTGE